MFLRLGVFDEPRPVQRDGPSRSFHTGQTTGTLVPYTTGRDGTRSRYLKSNGTGRDSAPLIENEPDGKGPGPVIRNLTGRDGTQTRSSRNNGTGPPVPSRSRTILVPYKV